jgi:hypothetical protein
MEKAENSPLGAMVVFFGHFSADQSDILKSFVKNKQIGISILERGGDDEDQLIEFVKGLGETKLELFALWVPENPGSLTVLPLAFLAGMDRVHHKFSTMLGIDFRTASFIAGGPGVDAPAIQALSKVFDSPIQKATTFDEFLSLAGDVIRDAQEYFDMQESENTGIDFDEMYNAEFEEYDDAEFLEPDALPEYTD